MYIYIYIYTTYIPLCNYYYNYTILYYILYPTLYLYPTLRLRSLRSLRPTYLILLHTPYPIHHTLLTRLILLPLLSLVPYNFSLPNLLNFCPYTISCQPYPSSAYLSLSLSLSHYFLPIHHTT